MKNNEETAMKFIDHMDHENPRWSENTDELVDAMIKYGNSLNKVASSQPITTEKLEKYGFINSDYGWDKAISPTHTLRIVKSNKWYYPHIYESPELSSENEQVVSLKMIMYIHELHNLYFVLNGEEMEHSCPPSVHESLKIHCGHHRCRKCGEVL